MYSKVTKKEMSSILADQWSPRIWAQMLGGGGLRGLSPWVCTAVHRSLNKLWRSNSIFNLCSVQRAHFEYLLYKTKILTSCISVVCILRIVIYNKFYPVYILEAKSQSLRPDISAYGGQAVSGNERTTSAPNFSQRGGGGGGGRGGTKLGSPAEALLDL